MRTTRTNQDKETLHCGTSEENEKNKRESISCARIRIASPRTTTIIARDAKEDQSKTQEPYCSDDEERGSIKTHRLPNQRKR